MNKMDEIKKTGRGIMQFMRGKYELDEVCVADAINFMHERMKVLSIYLHEDRYDFEISFDKEECDVFMMAKNDFTDKIIDLFKKSDFISNEKKILCSVRNLEDLYDIKPLILFKFKPNRKPFSKVNAVYGKCGHRCDLCIHYSDMDEKMRSKIAVNLEHVYHNSDWSMRCSGCGTADCYVKDGECYQMKCAYENKYEACVKCSDYPCSQATVGYQKLEPRSISADDVTWGILPYVPHQYGN